MEASLKFLNHIWCTLEILEPCIETLATKYEIIYGICWLSSLSPSLNEINIEFLLFSYKILFITNSLFSNNNVVNDVK